MTENTNIQDNIRAIKKDLRLSMNGVVSTLQRNQGLNYKINFGVEIPRLKGIASKYEKSEELAMTLWNDNIRECKMLAIFLMPESGYTDVAEKWIEETPFTEIADHLTMVILSNLPNAATKAIGWIQNSNGMFRYCGFITLTHLFRKGVELDKEQESIYLATAKSIEENDSRKTVIMAAYNSLGYYCDEEE